MVVRKPDHDVVWLDVLVQDARMMEVLRCDRELQGQIQQAPLPRRNQIATHAVSFAASHGHRVHWQVCGRSAALRIQLH